VEYLGRTSQEELYVVADKHDTLLGWIWICHLGINLQEIHSEQLVNSRALWVKK
jgi:hypothetical protein